MADDLVHLLLDIKLAGDGFASPDEFDLRDRLVERIERLGIGEVGGYGSGVGGMDISVLVADEAEGRGRLSRLMQEVAPDARFTIEVLADEDDG